MANVEEFIYFQFGKELEIPIYVKFAKNGFSPSISTFLTKNRFSELTATEVVALIKSVGKIRNMRLLTITLVTPSLGREIDRKGENDFFGPESIVLRAGHKVYKYKKFAMMIY